MPQESRSDLITFLAGIRSRRRHMGLIALRTQDCGDQLREFVAGEDTRNSPLDLVPRNLFKIDWVGRLHPLPTSLSDNLSDLRAYRLLAGRLRSELKQIELL